MGAGVGGCDQRTQDCLWRSSHNQAIMIMFKILMTAGEMNALYVGKK